ncbi:hypothetical protein [Nodularia sp. NIES-3585]|uniref:hypothetical protein n=1 Tax=Nodularia sp. NIES-3585 TaxID=1973477 RepID=UPI000B5C840C|nr:hypothetical protein [Nodularia sp. NIES-3585]GAX38848.1 hypothetical protein NIES3585_49000 [Nodularia sp. NIES-3585]
MNKPTTSTKITILGCVLISGILISTPVVAKNENISEGIRPYSISGTDIEKEKILLLEDQIKRERTYMVGFALISCLNLSTLVSFLYLDNLKKKEEN